jgi:hypothetical protein
MIAFVNYASWVTGMRGKSEVGPDEPRIGSPISVG